jgi:hypothetical protein
VSPAEPPDQPLENHATRQAAVAQTLPAGQYLPHDICFGSQRSSFVDNSKSSFTCVRITELGHERL